MKKTFAFRDEDLQLPSLLQLYQLRTTTQPPGELDYSDTLTILEGEESGNFVSVLKESSKLLAAIDVKEKLELFFECHEKALFNGLKRLSTILRPGRIGQLSGSSIIQVQPSRARPGARSHGESSRNGRQQSWRNLVTGPTITEFEGGCMWVLAG